MTAPRITIGGTVNLGSYENVKVEVEGTDAAGVVACLDETLAALGRGDAQTAAAVDSWRRRLLTSTINEVVPTPAPYVKKAERGPGDPNTCGKCGATPRADPTLLIARKDNVYQCVACLKAAKAEMDLHVPSSASGLETPRKMTIEEGEHVCLECGGRVSPSEEKTSRLLLKRVMCKKCLQTWTPPGEEAQG